MKPAVIRVSIITCWLALMVWFVRFEAFPHYFQHVMPGYRGVFADGTLVKDNWMKILFEGQPIGYSHTRVDTDDNNAVAQYVLRNETHLRLNIMGSMHDAVMTSKAALDSLYQLQRFDFDLTADKYEASIMGRRRSGDEFLLRVRTAMGTEWTRIDIPEDVIIYSPMTEMAMKDLEPGEYMRVRTMDPATMTIAETMIRAIAREKMEYQGAMLMATRFSIEMQGMEVKAWMNDDGLMLRQETPFGWTMEACTPEEALSYLHTNQEDMDILRAMAVPCVGEIRDPRACTSLTLKLEEVRIPAERLASGRQAIQPSHSLDDGLVLHVQSAVLPDHGTPIGTYPAEMNAFMEATPFVQSAHKDLIARANKIIDGETDSLKAALALCHWVDKAVANNPTVSMPSALDVLKTREGDCNEHTYLYVGLARAAGIPAKIKVGIVYLDGAFYYHAWPAVYVGEWIEMDPTFGQEVVDATHIALLEGELQNQVQLLSMVGKLRATVLEQGYDTPVVGEQSSSGVNQ